MTENLYTLSEIVDKRFSHGEDIPQSIIDSIKNIVSDGGYIGMAQINPIAGNIEYNAKKIAKYIKYASKINLDLVVFPELALMGYPIEDTIDRHPVIVEENIKWLKGLAKITTSTTAIVGFVEPRKKDAEGKKYFNSAAILKNGKIEGIVRKSLLPNYSEFNDYRYIEPSPIVGVQPAETLGIFDKDDIKPSSKLYDKFGISICEDCWNNKEFFEKNSLNIDFFIPEATYLLWLDFSKTGLSHLEIKNILLTKSKIALNDGVSFGSNGNKFFRLNTALSKKALNIALNQFVKNFSK